MRFIHRPARNCRCLLSLGVFCLVVITLTISVQAERIRTSFNRDWRFTMLAASGAETPTYADANWRQLTLPHDWGIEGEFRQDYPHETAKLKYWGVGWYRKTFTVPADRAGKQFHLDVDGAMSNARVWINGELVGGWAYGYASWRVDLTSHVKVGAKNVIAIRLDNPPDSSRWYPGGGIYRNVWWVETDPVYVAHWGVTVTTSQVGRDLARLNLRVAVANRTEAEVPVTAEATIYATDAVGHQVGKPIAQLPAQALIIPAWRDGVVDLAGTITKPQLWSPETPALYVAEVTVCQRGKVVDTYESTFGVRVIEFTADEGFRLNGERTEIKGVCLHHDLGALGAAFNYRARERQLEKLKELGCNAIRTSHNPAEPELLELCDRMGFLVMEEAFDAWRMAKRTNDYHVDFDAWASKDLRAMIRRDRNHPSVILWSLGNEVYEQREGTNASLASWLAGIAHEEDPTRPVNLALHVVAASTNGFQNAVDVFGYNYTPFGYADFRRNNPKIPLVGSETSSCVSSRGEYFFPVSENKKQGRVNFQCTSYDYAAPSWAYAPDVEFKAQDENPFVAGEFVWTGFDYLGEPTPFDRDMTNQLEFTDAKLAARAAADLTEFGKIRVPSRSSYFGIFDLCGFPKDRFYLYQARWRPELPMAHILPHWNWPERVGQVTPVHVYTSGDEAELFLNNQSLGRKKRGRFDYRLRWDDVVYQPGTLKVVAYKNDKRWATDVISTTGPATGIRVEADRQTIRADGQDLSFITVSVVDRDGKVVPRSANRVRFRVAGPGKLIATDNGDPTCHESFRSRERSVFNGLALAILRATPGIAGPITLIAEAEGLRGATVTIKSE